MRPAVRVDAEHDADCCAGGEVCVCDLVSNLHVPQPTVSRHLAYRRKAGLVLARKEGHWAYYRLAPADAPFQAALFECLSRCAAELPQPNGRGMLDLGGEYRLRGQHEFNATGTPGVSGNADFIIRNGRGDFKSTDDGNDRMRRLSQPGKLCVHCWYGDRTCGSLAMRLMIQIGLVALGSACGGVLRWGVGAGAARLLGTALPYGTIVINITGSLFLGWFLTVLADRISLSEQPWLRPDDLRLMLAVGLAGAYTTFSTFEWEAHSLYRDGESFAATGYMIASVALGLAAVRFGVLLARAI